MIPLLLSLFAPSADAYELSERSWLWQDNPVEDPFVINVNTFPGVYKRSEVEDGWLEGARTWNVQGQALISVANAGTTSVTQFGGGPDGSNTAMWTASTADGAVALSARTFVDFDIVDCDVQFYGANIDGTVVWFMDPTESAPSDEFNYLYTAVHEMGHCLGLSHSAETNAIMRPSQSPGLGPGDWDLTADDIAGLQERYGISAAELSLGAFQYDLASEQTPPGTEFDLSINVENIGTGAAAGVMGLLTQASGSEWIVPLTTSAEMGNINPGSSTGSVESALVYGLKVRDDCLNPGSATFDLTITDSLGNSWEDSVTIDVDCPEPERETVDDLDGSWAPGCSSFGGGTGWLALGLTLLLTRRRR